MGVRGNLLPVEINTNGKTHSVLADEWTHTRESCCSPNMFTRSGTLEQGTSMEVYYHYTRSLSTSLGASIRLLCKVYPLTGRCNVMRKKLSGEYMGRLYAAKNVLYTSI